MTDKENLREALASVFRRYIPDGYSSHPALVTDHNEAFLEIIFEAAQAHLATLDAVSKEDAELSFAWLKDREWEWPVGSTSQKRLETIYTLIRAHAGVS